VERSLDPIVSRLVAQRTCIERVRGVARASLRPKSVDEFSISLNTTEARFASMNVRNIWRVDR
jgi:hypothetical protein